VIKRYASDFKIDRGTAYGTAKSSLILRDAITAGSLETRVVIIREGDRLDSMAGRLLGDSKLWWILAACSNIGWGLQVPPGTVIRVPKDMSVVKVLIG